MRFLFTVVSLQFLLFLCFCGQNLINSGVGILNKITNVTHRNVPLSYACFTNFSFLVLHRTGRLQDGAQRQNPYCAASMVN